MFYTLYVLNIVTRKIELYFTRENINILINRWRISRI